MGACTSAVPMDALHFSRTVCPVVLTSLSCLHPSHCALLIFLLCAWQATCCSSPCQSPHSEQQRATTLMYLMLAWQCTELAAWVTTQFCSIIRVPVWIVPNLGGCIYTTQSSVPYAVHRHVTVPLHG
jgi:hypothetical protein